MKVLYAGDSAVDGPARYILGILKSLRAEVTHVPPGKKISSIFRRQHFNALILSDYSFGHLSAKDESWLIDCIQKGAGFLMVGGWASFSGPFGGWHRSKLQKYLPVQCLPRDDRKQFPSGAWVLPEMTHSMFGQISFQEPPVICGLNQVKVRPSGEVLLTACPVVWKQGRPGISKVRYPLFVIDKNPCKRVAALATDLAPHWCGGLVDWGGTLRKIQIRRGICIQVGIRYVQWAQAIFLWLAGRSPAGGEFETCPSI